MLKPDKDENGQEVQLERERHPLRQAGVRQAGVRPEKGKHQEPNAELKRERHPYRWPDVNRPSEREHLHETYSVKYEFCTRQIGGMYQE